MEVALETEEQTRREAAVAVREAARAESDATRALSAAKARAPASVPRQLRSKKLALPDPLAAVWLVGATCFAAHVRLGASVAAIAACRCNSGTVRVAMCLDCF